MELIGPRTTAAFGRLWSEIAAELKLDPENQVARAVATHETWSGIVISWPVDEGGERLPVELSGLPVFDRDRNFRGYRGFGVCRDIARINQLVRARRERPIGFMAQPEAPSAEGAPSATATPSATIAGAEVAAHRPQPQAKLSRTRRNHPADCRQCRAVSPGNAAGNEGAEPQPGGAQRVPRIGARIDGTLAWRKRGCARRRRRWCAGRGRGDGTRRCASGASVSGTSAHNMRTPPGGRPWPPSSRCCSTAFRSAY